jgi:hypothetical protein
VEADMPWTPTADTGILAVHAALVPTRDGSGEIVFFGGDQHNPPFTVSPNFDASRRLSLATQVVDYVHSPSFDLFCAGHCLLGDGRLLVAGGTKAFSADIAEGAAGLTHQELGHFSGHPYAASYDGLSHTFNDAAAMSRGRWYPTLVTLRDGKVLAIGGHPSASEYGIHNNHTPERYDPATDRWTVMPAFGEPNSNPDLYPRLHLLRTGQVLCASLHSVDRRFCVAYNASNGDWSPACGPPPLEYVGDYRKDSHHYPSVLLPLLPSDSYRPRILLCGGSRAYRIALDPDDEGWAETGTRAGAPPAPIRDHCCAVILPTGQVLVVGGVKDNKSDLDDDLFGVREPELYDPAIDWQSGWWTVGKKPHFGRYLEGTGTWQTLYEPAAVTRNYHSVALLLPDGRVWTAGSSRGGRFGDPHTTARLNYEIFTPPYPAGDGPDLLNPPEFVAYGERFEFQSRVAGLIRRVALIRCGSSTHAFNTDQRYIALEFELMDGATVACRAPPHGAVAPPGYYMLFIVDHVGRPCPRAAFVRVGARPAGCFAAIARALVKLREFVAHG